MNRSGFVPYVGLSLVLALGACGDGDDDDTDDHAHVDPSVSAVIPSTAYLGRTVDVTISGASTEWTSDTAVDFGAGITVADVRAGSATGLVATITVASDAAVGVRDVTVGGATYAGAFTVENPLEVTKIEGTVAQGSLAFATLIMKDQSTPFDITEAGDGLFTPISYPNLSFEIEGISAMIEPEQKPWLTRIPLQLAIDVDAPSGPAAVTVMSGPGEDALQSTTTLEVEAREPTMLTIDTPAMGNVTKPYASSLYSLMTTAGKVVTVDATSTTAGTSPSVVILPSSGSWADFVTQGAPAKFPGGGLFYAIYLDFSGDAGYMHTVEFSEGDPGETPAQETANNNCPGATDVGALPYSETDLALSSENDVDWFEITIGAADAGKTLSIVTSEGEVNTDTALQLFAADCATTIGDVVDADYHETLEADAIAEGTYYLRIAVSSFGYAGAYYDLDISVLEP